ncbi:hexosaminidase [Tenacibaculum sp. MAR_2009_124]|uniref:beta-N-acetylhexosaminidase n=1 Tax=Tenacibaculum sp. MAR_2009_124 TaxID=1250059 RepID=UPI000899598D|nr:family 20 glycosylhydrolase [Tenacibaculum sp. MAR_2009_124]SEB38651.1 hexosaminidase [Tenacibaculum sp. MAR_2009_124]
MKTTYYLGLVFMLLFVNCHENIPKPIYPSIIPAPASQTMKNGLFSLNNEVSIKIDDRFTNVGNYLKKYLSKNFNISLSDNTNDKKIVFNYNDQIENEEGYTLEVTQTMIIIEAKSPRGAFYAVQSLIQLMPLETEASQVSVQCIEIKDAPQFKYRGMHLDVGRHFFPTDFIKEYIDMIALLKINTFHWHLTEDQGWRIEIKKYPKLQEISAFRDGTLIGHYSDKPQRFDNKRYGGYYTQEEVKEIVAYATERQVTIIPEIEMPGHSQAVLAAYPEFGCTGNKVEVVQKWGVFEDIYSPKEETFKFLEDVIDEVIALFPSKYIHIGGDEAPKKQWKESKFCQDFIKKNGLKDEHELQSYFIQRMEKYINSKGRQIIGWDEILEGGLAPNATVMSWRGIKGAIEAAKEHHDVILTPGTHCYFDHYQSKNKNEPLAIGGFLPLEKVYSFNPIPEELTKEEAKYVLGAQGNVWTEYIPTTDKVEYMVYPRMMALSEVVWSPSENKNFDDFKKRLLHFMKRLDHLNVNYANHLFELNGQIYTQNGQTTYTLQSDTEGKSIRYTTDGTDPTISSTLYKKPIVIEKDTQLKAASFDSEGRVSNILDQQIFKHKAIGKKLSISALPHEKFNAGGKITLNNGILGSNKRHRDQEWLGFREDTLKLTYDLKEVIDINSLSARFHNGQYQWIYAPKEIWISFDNSKPEKIEVPRSKDWVVNFKTSFENRKAALVTITIPNYGIIKEGKRGAGNLSWLFLDEIIIN